MDKKLKILKKKIENLWLNLTMDLSQTSKASFIPPLSAMFSLIVKFPFIWKK